MPDSSAVGYTENEGKRQKAEGRSKVLRRRMKERKGRGDMTNPGLQAGGKVPLEQEAPLQAGGKVPLEQEAPLQAGGKVPLEQEAPLQAGGLKKKNLTYQNI